MKIKDKVKFIMEEFQRARDDDKFLYEMFIYKYYDNWIWHEDHLYIKVTAKVPALDTVSRRRRELQTEFEHLRAGELASKRRLKHRKELVNDIYKLPAHKFYKEEKIVQDMAKKTKPTFGNSNQIYELKYKKLI